MNLRFSYIKENEIKRTAIIDNWINGTVNITEKIASDWLCNGRAESILLFFNRRTRGGLHSYMPIVFDEIENLPELEEFEKPMGKAKIFGIEPYSISIESNGKLNEYDIHIINKIMLISYFEINVNGNKVYRVRC